MTVFVLGGGPTGMAIADGLIDNNAGPLVLFDQANSLGGLATTLTWPGVGEHDLGPHKMFTLDEALMRRVEALLPPNAWLTRDKASTIFMKGHFLPYPPSPFSLARVFGAGRFVKMVTDYAAARARQLLHTPAPATFEDDLKGRVGAALYDVLFQPIALKLWGDPATLDVKLSRGRVQTPSLAEILLRLMKVRRNSDFEALTFRYPRGGLRKMWLAIERKARDRGKILLETRVQSLEVRDRRVAAIRCANTKTGETMTFDVDENDFVASTLPLSLLVRLLADHLPAAVVDATQQFVILNDLLLVFFHTDTPSLLRESWIFVPDPDIVFHRISEQESFDPGMTPHGSIVCCEIMSNGTRPMSELSDDELASRARAGLRRMGLDGHKIIGHRVIRLPRSYPVFRSGYERGIASVLDALDSLSNLRTVGRQGAFNYIGTLDAMDIGYGFADWYARKSDRTWQAERQRTSHYPVLD